MDEYKVKIKEFINKSYKDLQLTDDLDIFATGGISSLFAMQLMLFLQKEFKIVISSEDLDINNFRTVNAISKLLEKKLESK